MNEFHLPCSEPSALRGAATVTSRKSRWRKTLATLVYGSILSFAIVASPRQAFAANPASNDMEELASAKGCYLCHRAKPPKRNPDDLLPFAPSWKDIAQRYRRQKGAEDRLIQIVLEGSGNDGKDRHWKGKVSEVGMFPNSQQVDEIQAKNLVHWILSFAP